MRGLGSARKVVTFQRRTFTIVKYAINGLALPIVNFALSFLVTRFSSVDLWGEFVEVLLIVQLGTHILYWGNKEYLL